MTFEISRNRKIALLMWLHGISLRDVADRFGVSRAYVCYALKHVHKSSYDIDKAVCELAGVSVDVLDETWEISTLPNIDGRQYPGPACVPVYVRDAVGEYIREKGISLRVLTNMLQGEVSHTTLYHVFWHGRRLSVANYEKICRALGLPAEYFIKEVDL